METRNKKQKNKVDNSGSNSCDQAELTVLRDRQSKDFTSLKDVLERVDDRRFDGAKEITE